MKSPRVRVTYAVCCACRQCRRETGRPFVTLDLSDTKRDALKDLEQRLNRHSDQCFLAQETLREMTPVRRVTTDNRKAA